MIEYFFLIMQSFKVEMKLDFRRIFENYQKYACMITASRPTTKAPGYNRCNPRMKFILQNVIAVFSRLLLS